MGVHAQLKSDLLTDGNTPGISSTEGMVRIPGGTFRMGSDKLYPEEAPGHRVTVGEFWIDTHPVCSRKVLKGGSHLRAQLLPPLPTCRVPCAAGRYVHQSCRISLRCS